MALEAERQNFKEIDWERKHKTRQRNVIDLIIMEARQFTLLLREEKGE